jgi:hypothetical protein
MARIGRRRANLRMAIMQRVTLVRYTARPERAAENEALSKAVFAELKASAPDHVCYALFRDGSEFLHLFVNVKDEESSPVTELASFKAFSRDIAERCETPPEATRFSLELVESYGFPSPSGGADQRRGGAAA